jgi:hypothetical protein
MSVFLKKYAIKKKWTIKLSHLLVQLTGISQAAFQKASKSESTLTDLLNVSFAEFHSGVTKDPTILISDSKLLGMWFHLAGDAVSHCRRQSPRVILMKHYD